MTQHRVCVIGVGYVGEHLLQTFQRHYHVVGVDTCTKRVAHLRNKYPQTIFQTNYEGIEECDTFLISVPTPVLDSGEIVLSHLHAVRDSLLRIVRPGSLIVVESSVHVGATRELFGDFLTHGVHVGFSPERVDPGRTHPSVQNIPKIVSGINDVSLSKVQQVYAKGFETLVPVSSTECAEMCKLYENCFRMVNIAFVNEIADMCGTVGIDAHEVVAASSTKPFGFMPFVPGLGVGGHCIPVNPYYLFSSNIPLPVLQLSTALMKQRPTQKMLELLRLHKPKRVLVMGIGFKKGEAVLTNSPGYAAFSFLKEHVDGVAAYDPIVQKAKSVRGCVRFVDEEQFNGRMLYNNYDLVLAVHPPSDEESKVLDEYSNLGGRIVRV